MAQVVDNSSEILMKKYEEICKKNGVKPSENEFNLLYLIANILVEITIKEVL